jgi:hypothetical protein
MTRARALKQIIRARAAKTGERYTTARRHVLKNVAGAAHMEGRRRPVRGTPDAPATLNAARTKVAAQPTPTPVAAKGSVSDAKAREKTGHGLDHWFAVLDQFGGVEKGHTASARHLHDDHGVPGWYAQGITVAYERARGARTLNQRMSGDYEVSVSKVVGGDTGAVVRAFTDPRQRAQWLATADPELSAALAAALQARSSKGVVVRSDGQGRFRYKWGTTTVQFYLLPKPDGRTSVVVTHMKLPDGVTLESSRATWRAALASLARHVGSTS